MIPVAVVPASAETMTPNRETCIAADIAKKRGYNAMAGTRYMGEDGKPYSIGETTSSGEYNLKGLDEGRIASFADEWTPSAVEYVDLWLLGPGSIGRSTERILTDRAKVFISFYASCLDLFNGSMRR
jgi:hypothetical protein